MAKYQYNKAFANILANYGIPIEYECKLTGKISNLLKSPIIHTGGCYFMEFSSSTLVKKSAKGVFYSLYDNESFENLIYIDDYFRSDVSFVNLLKSAMSFCNKLANRLFDINPEFIVLCLLEKNDIENELFAKMPYFVKITFYKKRKGYSTFYKIVETDDLGMMKIIK